MRAGRGARRAHYFAEAAGGHATSSVFDQTLARLKAAPGWKTYGERSSGHDVMIDMPDRLVEILLEVA